MTQPDDLDRRLEALGEAEETAALSPPVQEELRALERLLRRRVRRICLKTLLAVAICTALGVGLVNPLVKLTTFNPISMEEDGQSFTNYLNAYFSAMQPYVRVTGTNIRATGLGTYDAAVYVVGRKELRTYIGGYTDVHLTIRQGEAEVTSDPTGKLANYLNRFDSALLAPGELMVELEKLPDSAYIRLSVGTDTPLTPEQLRALPAEVVWAQIYDPGVSYQGGVSFLSPPLSDGEPDPGTLDGGTLVGYYADTLELLLTQPSLLTSLGIFSGERVYDTTNVVEEALASARGIEVFTSQNYCVQGSKEEILALLDQVKPVSLMVDHIFLTPLSD